MKEFPKTQNSATLNLYVKSICFLGGGFWSNLLPLKLEVYKTTENLMFLIKIGGLAEILAQKPPP